MSRLVFLSIAIVLSLLTVVEPAAPAHKRPAPRWHGYGFLPGYHQPPNNSLPAYKQRAAVSRMARRQPAPLVYRSSPKLLRVRWRLALFRPARLLRRSLQWRQLRPVLDADADRADLELRLIELSLGDTRACPRSPTTSAAVAMVRQGLRAAPPKCRSGICRQMSLRHRSKRSARQGCRSCRD